MRVVVLLVCLCGSALAADPPKKDTFGDPLPEGALLRLGNTRGAPIGSFGIQKDGTIISVREGAAGVEVRRWKPDANRPELVKTFAVPGGTRWSLWPSVSHDGKYVAAGAANKALVYETPGDSEAEPKLVAEFDIPGASWILFSPDGTKVLVSGNQQRAVTLQLCDMATRAIRSFEIGAPELLGLKFSADGTRIVGKTTKECYLWDAATGKQLGACATPKQLAAVAPDATGSRLAVCVSGENGWHWELWDPRTGGALAGHTAPPRDAEVSFSPSGALWLRRPTGLQEWDPKTGKVLCEFAFAGDASRELDAPVLAPGGKVLVASTGYALYRWDAATGKALSPAARGGHREYPWTFGASADGKRLVTASHDGRVIGWDGTTGAQLWTVPGHTCGSDIDFAADGASFIAAEGEKGRAAKFDAATGKVLRTYVLDPDEAKQSGYFSLRLSPDGATVIGLSYPSQVPNPMLVTRWNAGTGERLSTVRVRDALPRGGNLSRDGKLLDLGLHGLRVPGVNPNPLADVRVPFAFVPGRFTPNGEWLARVAMDNENGALNYSAVVVRTSDWKMVATVPMPKHGRAAVSPDGRTLAVVRRDRLALHDVATGKELVAHTVPLDDWKTLREELVPCVWFLPDGKRVATAQVDTTVLVWPVPARAK